MKQMEYLGGRAQDPLQVAESATLLRKIAITMAINKIILLGITLSILISACDGNILERFLETFFGIKAGKRSLSDMITTYLDELFGKDDEESDFMKEIYMIYSNDDDDSQFNNNIVG